MKKVIVSIVVFLFAFIFLSPVFGQGSNERWTDGNIEYERQGSGSSIVLISTSAKESRPAGITFLRGTITGTTFSGSQHLVADECPNLDHDVSTTTTTRQVVQMIRVQNPKTLVLIQNLVQKKPPQLDLP